MSTAAKRSDDPKHEFSAKRIVRVLLWSIIAGGMILAALVFWNTMSHPHRGQKNVQSIAMGTSVMTAVESYHVEYGKLPVPEGLPQVRGGSELVTDEPQGGEFLRMLHHDNPRGIAFFSIKGGRNKKDGLMYAKDNTVTALYDAWGNPYHIVLDTKGDGVLVTKRGKKTETIRGRRCIVFSAGRDRELGTRDDLLSWK